MRAIDFGTAFRALNTYTDEYNYKTEKLADKLRQTTISTAQDIIRIYAMAFRRNEQLKTKAGINDTTIPSVFLNNVQLSSRLKINKRTVQRHIAKLQETGIITAKLWHGTNSGYEVWLNEKILGIGEKQEYPTIQNTETVNDPKENATSCRHTVSCTKDTNIIINSPVEKCITELKQAFTGYIVGDTERMARPLPEYDSRVSKWNQNEPAAGGDGFSTNKEFYVDSFWSSAKKKLYSDKEFSPEETERTKEHLLAYYSVLPEHLYATHLVYLKRIEMVQKFIKRDPVNRFVPPPIKYFDIQNPKGFTATKAWYENYKKRLNELREQSEMKRIISHYLKALSETNLTKPLYELYRQCEESLSRFSNQSLLESFYQAVRDKTPVLFLKNTNDGLLR